VSDSDADVVDVVIVSGSVVVVDVIPVPDARIVIVLVAAVAVGDAVNTSVPVVPVPPLGTKAAVTPVGRFSAESVTASVNPVRTKFLAGFPLDPCGPESVAGDGAEIVTEPLKLAAVTVTAIVVVAASMSEPVARIVIVAAPSVAVAEAVRVSVDVFPVVLFGK